MADVSVLAVVAVSGGSVLAVRLLFVGVAGWRVLVLLGGAAQGEAAELVEGKVEVSGGVGLAAWSAHEQR
ncbi:hypothetical protein [Actinomyces qiguomingii]|uniref:hypothetical protein n=1 Tax=Actinomyces qiguomingii TaxID=2057800 RepID=UPI000CA052E1|nr:hypothetical protein [Actinomyces qiguomingii]